MSEPNKKPTWSEVFEALDAADFPEDFMEDRDRSMPQDRGDILDFADDDSEPLTNEDCE